jgi:hypothetical protein
MFGAEVTHLEKNEAEVIEDCKEKYCILCSYY